MKPSGFHGKEGVIGSSPMEGSRKGAATGAFLLSEPAIAELVRSAEATLRQQWTEVNDRWCSYARLFMDASSAISQLDDLLQQIEPGIQQKHGQYGVGTYHVFEGPEPSAQRLVTRAVAAVERLAPRDSRYVVDATGDVLDQGPRSSLPTLAGILRALRDDYEAGYMRSIEELIHADVFADFLEMADELLTKQYKDAAAVIAGSVLEEHLRKLAVVHGVAVESPDGKPRKAEVINADLVKAEAYNKHEQKSITAWLGLRNDAAHGHYDQYGAGQVEALIRDVRAFMVRHAA